MNHLNFVYESGADDEYTLVAVEFEDDLFLEQYEMYTKVIRDLQPTLIAFDAVRTSYDRFQNFILHGVQEYSPRSTFLVDRDIATVLSCYGMANGLIVGLLGSCSMFLSVSEREIQEQFGKSSEALKSFQAYKSQLYDGHFEYRLAYKIRNYCQHNSLPFDNLKVRGIADDSGVMSYTFNLTINPRTLAIRGKKFMKARICEELKQLTSSISVEAMLYRYMMSMRELAYVSVNYREKQLLECSRFLSAVRGMSPRPNPLGILKTDEKVLAHPVGVEGRVKLDLAGEVIPFGQLDYILQSYYSLGLSYEL